MKELAWEQIPEAVKHLTLAFAQGIEFRLFWANKIMEAMKPEQEKAWYDGMFTGTNPDSQEDDNFETWYNKTYNSCQPKK